MDAILLSKTKYKDDFEENVGKKSQEGGVKEGKLNTVDKEINSVVIVPENLNI